MAVPSHPLSLRGWLLRLFAVALLIGFYFVVADHLQPSTDDAYVQAYTAQISPQVAGRVEAIYVENNSYVKHRQVLMQIDPRTYQHQVDSLKSQVTQAEQTVGSLQAQIVEAQKVIKQREADAVYAKIFYDDMHYLAPREAVSVLQKQQAFDQLQSANAQLAASHAKLQGLIATLGTPINGEYAVVRTAKANLAKAKVDLGETVVHAPSDGFITNMNIAKGTYAHAGTGILTFIANDNWWIFANIKENNLSRIRKGQRVDINLNIYPGKTFHGYVDSIGYGVNLRTALPDGYLPYIEKTTNWVQLAQRFPVQIRFDASYNPEQYPLRVGTTAYVTIYTDRFGLTHAIS